MFRKLKGGIAVLIPVTTLLATGVPTVLAYDYGAPNIRQHFAEKRAAWGLFPLGYWAWDGSISEERINSTKLFNFDSLIIRNNDFNLPYLQSMGRRLNKLVIQEPKPVSILDPVLDSTGFHDFNILATAKTLGRAEVRQVSVSPVPFPNPLPFEVIARCYVVDGQFTRSNSFRVLRNNTVVHIGELKNIEIRFNGVKDNAQTGEEFRIRNLSLEEGDILETFMVEKADTDLFRNTKNISFLLVDEPFEQGLYDPTRVSGNGTRVGSFYNPDPAAQALDYSHGGVLGLSLEDIYVNQHLFLYGHDKATAEAILTTNAQKWAEIYADFNRYSASLADSTKRTPTLVSLSGAASKKPSMNLIIRKLLDKIIRDNTPSAFKWVNDDPVPTVQAMEKLAKWQAYKQISELNSQMQVLYAQKVTDAFTDFHKQLQDDVIKSLKGWTAVTCFFDPECSLFVSLLFLGFDPFTDLLSDDPGSILLQYIEQIPAYNVEILEPYDILFREFKDKGVKLDGVLTHIYPLRDSHDDLYVETGKDKPDKYSGFPFQGRKGSTLLSFKNNRDFLTYVSRPVGLSAITGVLQTVRGNLDNNNYSTVPLYLTAQVTGSGAASDDILHRFGGTDPRTVNADEIRATMNVAYLSGANGIFAWEDCWRKYERKEDGTLKKDPAGNAIVDYNSGLFNASGTDGTISTCSGNPAVDLSGKPRLEGVMWASTDIMDTENYLEWSVGPNRTTQVLSEALEDDIWTVKLKYDEKPRSEFVAIMNRRTSDAPRDYLPSSVRTVTVSMDKSRYVRLCRFPAGPNNQAQKMFSIELQPGQFVMFETSDTPFTDSRYRGILNGEILSPLFSGRQNDIQINFSPDALTPNYTVRVYLEKSVVDIADRVFLYETEIRTGGPQSIRFSAPLPMSWPVSGGTLDRGSILLVVDKPGISRLERFRFEVNVNSTSLDSDQDGLTDADEIYAYHTNPYNRDSDSDGIPDGEEIRNGTDPNVPNDITSALELLLLNPLADLAVIGSDQVSFSTVKVYPPSSDKTGCIPQTAFVGKYGFDALLTNKPTSPALSDIRLEIAQLANKNNGNKENRVIMPDGGMGKEGDQFAFPRVSGYSDGLLLPSESTGIHFDICLGSKDPFRFFVNVLGIAVPSKASQRAFEVNVAKGVLFVDAKDAPLAKVFEEIGKQAGFAVEGNLDPAETVTIRLDNVPLEKGIKRLSSNVTILHGAKPNEKGHRIRRIVVPAEDQQNTTRSKDVKRTQPNKPPKSKPRPEPFKFELDPTKPAKK